MDSLSQGWSQHTTHQMQAPPKLVQLQRDKNEKQVVVVRTVVHTKTLNINIMVLQQCNDVRTLIFTFKVNILRVGLEHTYLFGYSHIVSSELSVLFYFLEKFGIMS